MSLIKWQNGIDYELYVPKSERNWIVKDDPEAEDQRYTPAEAALAEKLTWQDVSILA